MNINIAEVMDYWWVAVGLLALPLAFCGGYYSAILRDSEKRGKRRAGHVYTALAVVCLLLANIYSPAVSAEARPSIVTSWMVAYIALGAVWGLGRHERQYISKGGINYL